MNEATVKFFEELEKKNDITVGAGYVLTDKRDKDTTAMTFRCGCNVNQ